MRFRAIVGSLFAAAALVLLTPDRRLAPTIQSTCRAPTCSTRRGPRDGGAAARTALDGLYDRTQISLFVVLVDSFENPSETAPPGPTRRRRGAACGTGDVLLAIAVGDREYQWSVDAAFPLSDEQIGSGRRPDG